MTNPLCDFIWDMTGAVWWGSESGVEHAYSNGIGNLFGDGKEYSYGDGMVYGASHSYSADSQYDYCDGDEGNGGYGYSF